MYADGSSRGGREVGVPECGDGIGVAVTVVVKTDATRVRSQKKQGKTNIIIAAMTQEPWITKVIGVKWATLRGEEFRSRGRVENRGLEQSPYTQPERGARRVEVASDALLAEVGARRRVVLSNDDCGYVALHSGVTETVGLAILDEGRTSSHHWREVEVADQGGSCPCVKIESKQGG